MQSDGSARHVHFSRPNNVYRRPAWAVIHETALTERKGLRSAKFRTLLDLAETSLAGTSMGFIVHAKVILREATRPIAVVEGAIAAVEDVQVRIAEVWIVGSIHSSILFAKIRGPDIDVSKC
jgi:hypothetical protein